MNHPELSCATHPWQPALGTCDQCGRRICVRCGAGQGSELFCFECSAQLPEPAPHDGDGRWLDTFRATTWLVWRHPATFFSRLADGRFNPAWNFATVWSVIGALVRETSDDGTTSRLVGVVLLASIATPVRLVLSGSLFGLWVRLLGGHMTWKLALRGQGYSDAWVGPALLVSAVAVSWASEPTWWWATVIAGKLILNGAQAYCLYELGHGRGGLTRPRAAAASLLDMVPGVLIGVLATYWIRPQ